MINRRYQTIKKFWFLTEEVECLDYTEELTLEPIDNINLCFKSMEILGQILKNYCGFLKVDIKNQIALELYEVGLRGLNDAYSTIRESKDELSKRIEIDIKNKDSLTPSEIEQKSNQMVYGVVILFTYAYLSKIVYSIGDKNLKSIYQYINKILDYESVELINLCIHLEYYNKKFPFEQVKDMLDKYDDNDVRILILRSFVQKYLYMYCADIKERQQICNSFNVDKRSILIKQTIK